MACPAERRTDPMAEKIRDIVNPRRSGVDGRNVGHQFCQMHSKGHYGGTDLRRTFKTPEGSYQLKSETRHGQVAHATSLASLPYMPYQVTYMDRQSARMTLGCVEDGDEKGDYIIFNIGDALHLLHFDNDEGVRSHLLLDCD